MARERFKTHELVRWWLQRNEAVRLHVLRLLLRVPHGTRFLRVGWHDTHPSLDTPGLEADALFDVWFDPIDATMVVVEVQLSPDAHKAITWAAYLVNTRLRYGKPTLLGILTFDRRIQAWAEDIVPRIAASDVHVRVLGPDILGRELVRGEPRHDLLQRYVLAWLAGQRIAEYEQALIDMLEQALAMDIETGRWYIFTLYRIAQMHAPHAKEQMMNHVKSFTAFQPLFDWEFEAWDLAFAKGEAAGLRKGYKQGLEQGREKGRIAVYTELLIKRLGADAVAKLLVGVDESEHERVLREALDR